MTHFASILRFLGIGYNIRMSLKTFLWIIVIITIISIWVDRSFPTTTHAQNQQATDVVQQKNTAMPPRPFIFDGCTLFPDKIGTLSLKEICLAHDIAYWIGGTPDEKKAADQKFKDDLSDSGIVGKIISPIAYTGVVIFGDTWLTRQFNANWGFGWNE